MTVIITEDPQSRQIEFGSKSASATYMFKIKGPTSSDDALAWLADYSPPSVVVAGHICGDPTYRIDPVHTPTDYGKSLYAGTVSYKTPDRTDTGDEPQQPEDPTSFSFDFSVLEDVKLAVPKGDQISYFSDGKGGTKLSKDETALNKQHPNLKPEGIKYNTPIATFTSKTVIAGWVATNDWFKARLDQLWTTNVATFKSLPPKSVMFTGLSGSPRKADGHWDITYNFEYRPKKAGSVFDTGVDKEVITVPDTDGWQVLWLEYQDMKETDDQKAPNESDKKVSRQVSKVHVADIYPESDFTQLGLVD